MNTVQYVEHGGSDLSVVNAARVSLGKQKTELDESDVKLINYLATHDHTSPFRHCSITLRVSCPIFVARQIFKHRIGSEINEISGRYVKFNECFYSPEVFRKGSPSIKQGSLDQAVDDNEEAKAIYIETIDFMFKAYEDLLALGVCKEQARAILPLALMTEFVWTLSLQAAFHFWKLRSDPHAQYETRQIAYRVEELIQPLFPHSWQALKDSNSKRSGL